MYFPYVRVCLHGVYILITGHTLVVPKTHVARLANLDDRQAAAIMRGVVDVSRAMNKGKTELVTLDSQQPVALRVYRWRQIKNMHKLSTM